MTYFIRLEQWSEKHHKIWMDFLRILLGLIILVKGFVFINDSLALTKMLQISFGINSVLLAQFIAFMHLILGFMIIIGLGTRLSCALLLPILVIAVFYVNIHTGSIPADEMLLSILTLALLVFFFFEGSGKISVTYFLINSKRSRQTDEAEKPHVGGSLAAPLDKDGNVD